MPFNSLSSGMATIQQDENKTPRENGNKYAAAATADGGCGVEEGGGGG